jgi:outer membrane protein assembly factor BamD
MKQSVYALLAALMLLGGCATKSVLDETEGWSPERLYGEAKSALDTADYDRAIKYFEALQARYPLGAYAQQAQMEIAYAYYRDDDPQSATLAADRFLKLYPRHPKADYIWYLKGLINYNVSLGTIERYVAVDLSQRDQAAARRSFNDFAELLKLYPDSLYAPDARQRMLHLRNNLAQYELHVADFYMRRGAYLAAANRAQQVITHFDQAPAVPDALALLVQAYEKMAMPELAADALSVLKLNYPDHPLARQRGASGI